MDCDVCGRALERPGDRCLACGTVHTDAIILEVTPERATLTFCDGDEIRGHTDITTRPETDERLREQQQRNYVARIADEIRRKGADAVHATGERETIRRLRRSVTGEWYRIDDVDPVETYITQRGTEPLAIVDGAVEDKLGGAHTTVIGGRHGATILHEIASHPHVKKIVPGPIDAGGQGSQTGVRGKITRADDRGNLRLLIRDGSSVQTVRVITTARNHREGVRIRDQLSAHLSDI